MRFTIYYRGPLKANGGPKEKQHIRRCIHPQIRELWKKPPLSGFDKLLQKHDDPQDLSVLYDLGQFTFAPLVTEPVNASETLLGIN